MDAKVAQWLAGRDTGISSKAIVAVMESAAQIESFGQNDNHPHDPSDLGRCIRLLDLAPAYRERLSLMRGVSPAWSVLVDHWTELEALYLEEFPTHYAPKCYARMKELLASVGAW